MTEGITSSEINKIKNAKVSKEEFRKVVYSKYVRGLKVVITKSYNGSYSGEINNRFITSSYDLNEIFSELNNVFIEQKRSAFAVN